MREIINLKVALIGNMNNNHFALIRYLRDIGIEAELLLFQDEYEHFHPSCDTFIDEYNNYTKKLTWGTEFGVFGSDIKRVINDLQNYDVLIGTGFAPAYLHKAGLYLDIFIPYGYDLYWATQYRFLSPKYFFRHIVSVFYQKLGIGKCKIVHMPPTNSLYEGRVDSLAPKAERWTSGFPLIYAPEYERYGIEEMFSKTNYGQDFIDIRNSCDLMVIAHGRHFWAGLDNPAAKGNDILLKGWALFCKGNPNIKCKLVLMDYGIDVDRSKSLILELGLSNNIAWLPQMHRKDLMPGIFIADIVAGEFANSWMTSGVLYEALVAKKPILAYRNDSLYTDICPNLYPILNAKDPQSIALRLNEFISNPSVVKLIGEIGYKWYEDEVVTKSIPNYFNYIKNKADFLGKNATKTC